MKYPNIIRGTFVNRPNRFIANIEVENNLCVCHVKNTGRCTGLLYEGCEVYVQDKRSENRKTGFDLISVRKGDRIINIDSQIPNQLAFDYVKNGGLGFIPEDIRREVTYKDSRFDIYAKKLDGTKCFIEVKGVTKENDNVVCFPDAPSARAVKHVNELVDAMENGYESYILFVIQMENVIKFVPDYEIDPLFSQTLIEANKKGVRVLAVDSLVKSDEIIINNQVPVDLS